jgi:hypothetical protein
MKVQDQEKALMDLVEEYQETECRHTLEKATEEAARIVSRVYKENRQLLHERVVAERKRAEARIRMAQAELETTRRRHRQQSSLALLKKGWQQLKPRLELRWQDLALRKQWVDVVLRGALETLPRRNWIIRHPPGWDEQEQKAVVTELANQLETSPLFESEQRIHAGLIIESDGNRLDATPDGLLTDRDALEARLLALLDREQSP